MDQSGNLPKAVGIWESSSDMKLYWSEGQTTEKLRPEKEDQRYNKNLAHS